MWCLAADSARFMPASAWPEWRCSYPPCSERRPSMHYDMPIEQLVRRADTRFQLGFANEARRVVPEADDFRLHASAQGLCVLGRNEDSLGRPIRVLKEIYPSSLHIEPPRVRVMRDGQVKEPVMHLRVSLEARFLD